MRARQPAETEFTVRNAQQTLGGTLRRKRVGYPTTCSWVSFFVL